MAISTQTIGILVMAAMAVFGLAVLSDIAKQNSVVERMLYYQADEIAMDIENMESWDDGYIEKDLPRDDYNITVRDPSVTFADKYSDTPRLLVLGSRNQKEKAAIQTDFATVPDPDLQGVGVLCIEKTGASITMDKGEC